MTLKASETALTECDITAHALAMIDEEGLGKFSIRRLAQAMNVYPTAVLWHIGSRDDLLAKVVEKVLENLPPDTSGLTWQQSLLAIALDYRGAVKAHPNISPLLGADLTSNAGVNFGFVEAILEALAGAGYSGQAIVDAYNSFSGAFIGFVTLEFSPQPKNSGKALKSDILRRLDDLSEQEFPHLTSLRTQMTDKAFVTRWSSGNEAPMEEAYHALIEMLVRSLDKKKQDFKGI
ncbi:TetR/AcrR family transcriptional regulator [Aestuariispira insulae]|uniref:TetR family transcriptional regulator n=1 Tax=Aestuariispira insulae TaxID=1461337 RepID=A0A3D9HF58_9PROT|nr:TetR/AcrR family transcriptional regulator C-terminal domain-containing protein [Aestuariispira insulae]RED48110.1 TetR family transcriptional regulator [Aestuariispira insulae]